MGDKEIKEGDEVSWQWSGSRPGGEAVEVAKEGEIAIQSKKGNTIKKNADPENPAVHISRSGNDVVKRASELDVEKPGDKHAEKSGEQKEVGDKKDDEDKKEDGDDKENKEDKKEENGDAKTGEKRNADAVEDDKKDDDEEEEEEEDEEEKEEPSSKKQKTDGDAKENGDKKKAGRPKKSESTSKPKKEPKKAATESGAPRRSSRNKA